MGDRMNRQIGKVLYVYPNPPGTCEICKQPSTVKPYGGTAIWKCVQCTELNEMETVTLSSNMTGNAIAVVFGAPIVPSVQHFYEYGRNN